MTNTQSVESKSYYGKVYEIEKWDGGFLVRLPEHPELTVIRKETYNANNFRKAVQKLKMRVADKQAMAPRCKGCQKTPDQIEEYKYQKDPITFVLENERLTPDGRFYCTSCYIKAGMPLW